MIINAGDAMPQGGKLTITSKEETLETSREVKGERRKDDPPGVDYSHLRGSNSFHLSAAQFFPIGKFLKIVFSDAGTGIKDEDLAKIFDPFFTTKDPGRGTGLGLSICLRIIESFRGKIRVDSEVGKGTSFIIYLPLTSPVSKYL